MRSAPFRAIAFLFMALFAFACENGPTAPTRSRELAVVQPQSADRLTLFSNSATAEGDRAADQCTSQPPINRGPPRLILTNESNNGLTVRWDYPRTEERPAYWCLSYRAPLGSATIDFPGDMMTVSATGLPPGNYFFTICPGYAGGVGDCTSDSLTIASQTSNPPRNLRYTQNGRNVTLSWDAPSCCLNSVPPTTYVLVVNGQAQVIGLVTQTTLNLPPATYTVTVLARNAAGDSVPSNAVSFTIASCTGPPAVPMVGVAVRGTYVALLWSRSPEDLDRLETYDIELAGAIVVSGLPVASVDGNLNPGTYAVRIRAVNACGSSWSDVVRVVVEGTPPPPPPPLPPPGGAAVSNVRIFLTGCGGSADPLPGWRNCTGRVTMDVDADIRTGWIQVVFAFPVSGSFYQGAVQITPGRVRRNVSVDVRNGYVSSCPSTYASSIGVSDGRQGIDPGFNRFATVPITLHCE